jgi:hypothetical protein
MKVADAGRTAKYHHVMEADNVLAAGLSTYPTASAPTTTTSDNDKTCLQCHADHNIFRPNVNTSNTLGRGANLRSRIANGPPTGNPPAPSAPGDVAPGYYTNMDRDAAFTAGGICLSCHATAQTKDQTNQKSDGTIATYAVAATAYGTSAHAYAVNGP